MKKKILIFPQILIAIAVFFTACNDVFDVDSVSSVEESNMYRNVSDANAAVLGVYSKFLNIADKYVILNEVRADLIDVTSNADQELCDINNHTVVTGNTYADPRPFYNVILNINDVVKHLAIMHTNSLLTDDEYNYRYSDMVALRSWIYLQLAIHYGTIPYVTKPFEDVSDLSDSTLYPYISLKDMVDTLVNTVSNLPYLYAYPSTESEIMDKTSGTYNTTPFFISKKMLLGDLYLWKGAVYGVEDGSDGSYLKAASCYKDILDLDDDLYILKMHSNDIDISKTPNVVSSGLSVDYWYRYDKSNVNYLIDDDEVGWRSIFCRSQDNVYDYEWIWQLFYDPTYGKNSPFIKYFANYGQGEYLLKPSQQVLDYWNSQTQFNGFPYDARRLLSTTTKNGELLVRKYIYEYDESSPYIKNGRLFLYRAAGLYLHYIEAANRDGKCKVALALLNRGIKAEFSPSYSSAGELGNGSESLVDITNYERTDGSVYGFEYPYNFDARYGYNNSAGTQQIPVNIRAPYCMSQGVRLRAYVKPVLLNMYTPTDLTVTTTSELQDSIENYTIQEDALELAFEGERWNDLLRIAIRRGDPSFIADKVYQKLLKAGNSNAEAVHQKLLKGDYFLPFSLK